MKKICVFGDSISKGVIIDKINDHYYITKKSYINILSCYMPLIQIKNFAMFGCTISKGRSLINRHIEDIKSCDAVLLEYGGNDCDFDWSAIAETPSENHLPKTPLDAFTANYHCIIKYLSSFCKKIILLNLPPIDEKKYFNWFADSLKKDNIISWLNGDIHHIYEYHSSYSDKVREIASEYNLPMIDIRTEFLRQPNYSDYLCPDGIHPNVKGHALIAQIIKEHLPQLYYSFIVHPSSLPDNPY